jgi:hypothetical protein
MSVDGDLRSQGGAASRRDGCLTGPSRVQEEGWRRSVEPYTFDKALEDTLSGKIDLARSRFSQTDSIRETATLLVSKFRKD